MTDQNQLTAASMTVNSTMGGLTALTGSAAGVRRSSATSHHWLRSRNCDDLTSKADDGITDCETSETPSGNHSAPRKPGLRQVDSEVSFGIGNHGDDRQFPPPSDTADAERTPQQQQMTQPWNSQLSPPVESKTERATTRISVFPPSAGYPLTPATYPVIERGERPPDVAFVPPFGNIVGNNMVDFANNSVPNRVFLSATSVSNRAGMGPSSVDGYQNGWGSDAALRQSPELSETGQLVYTPRRVPSAGMAMVDGSGRAYSNVAAQQLRPSLGEDNPVVGRNGGMVSHMDLGRNRDSSIGCDRAQDVCRSDQSSASSAVPLEGPDSVNGVQWAGAAADYSMCMGNFRSAVGQSSQVQCIPVDFHRQPPKADVVRFVPANPVCQAPSCVTVTGNSCVDSGCGSSDGDLDGVHGVPDIGSDGLLRSASQTVQPIVLPLCQSDLAATVDRAVCQNDVVTVPVDVRHVSSFVNTECTGFPPARRTSVDAGMDSYTLLI